MGTTLSFIFGPSLFSAVFPYWGFFWAAVGLSSTFPRPGSAPPCAGFPPQRVSASMGWGLPRAAIPPFIPLPSGLPPPPGRSPGWEQSRLLPSSPHPPTSLPSPAVIFNPGRCLSSPCGLLLLPIETGCETTELTPTSSGSPQPFSPWAAHPPLLETSPLATWKMGPAFSTALALEDRLLLPLSWTREAARHNVRRLQ